LLDRSRSDRERLGGKYSSLMGEGRGELTAREQSGFSRDISGNRCGVIRTSGGVGVKARGGIDTNLNHGDKRTQEESAPWPY